MRSNTWLISRVGQAKDLAGGLIIALPCQQAPGSELAIVQFSHVDVEVRLHLEAHFYQLLARDQEQVATPANHVVAILLTLDDSPVAPMNTALSMRQGVRITAWTGFFGNRARGLGCVPPPAATSRAL